MTSQDLTQFNSDVNNNIVLKTELHSIKKENVGSYFKQLAAWVFELFTRLPARWVSGSITPIGARRSFAVNGKEYDFISLQDNNSSQPSITNDTWLIIGYDAGDIPTPSVIEVIKKSNYYISYEHLSAQNSVIIPELIGCNLEYFNAHRGVGTVIGGSAAEPSEWNVKVIPETGEVIFFYEFTDVAEILWFDYKINSDIIIPPDPGGDGFNFIGTTNWLGDSNWE